MEWSSCRPFFFPPCEGSTWPAWCRWRWAATTGSWTAPSGPSGWQSSASSWRNPSPCCSDQTVKAGPGRTEPSRPGPGHRRDPSRSLLWLASLPIRSLPVVPRGEEAEVTPLPPHPPCLSLRVSFPLSVCLPPSVCPSVLTLTHLLFIESALNAERAEFGPIPPRIANNFSKGNVTSQRFELNR